MPGGRSAKSVPSAGIAGISRHWEKRMIENPVHILKI